MSSRIGDLLLHPYTFFSGKSNETVNLIPPFALVGAGAVFIAIIHVLFVVWDRSGWNADVLTYSDLTQHYITSSIATSIFMPFFIWGLFSVLIFGFSRIAGGTGSFPATVQNVGYGMVPWTLSAIIPLVIFLYRFITYTGGPTFGGYSGLWLLPPVFCALPLLGIMIWSSYLWIIAIIHMDHLPLMKSAIITLVPVCIFLILSLPVLYYGEMIQFLMIRA
jgi:hypothetical protein